MSRADYPFWSFSNPEPNDDPTPTDEPAIPAPGSGLCPVPHRARKALVDGQLRFVGGHRCEYDDGNPRKVLAGLLICGRHRYAAEKQLADLVDLWELLGDPTRTKARSLGGRTKGEPPAPNSDAVQQRQAIEGVLHRVENVIREVNQTPPIDPEQVRAQTQRLIIDTSTAIRDATGDLRVAQNGDAHAGIKPNHAKAVKLHERLKELRDRMAGLERDKASGRDVIAAQSERCQRHLDGLAANADRIVQVIVDIENVWRDATKTAHPLPEGVRVACPKCGTRVRLRHGGDFEEIWCPGEVEGVDGMEPCGEHANAMGWAQLLGVKADSLTEEEAVVWLQEHHRMKIAGATIRDWVRRGKLTGSTEVRDGKHRTVYHPVQLLEAATTYKPRTGAAS